MGFWDIFKKKPNLEIVGETKGQEAMINFISNNSFDETKFNILLTNLEKFVTKTPTLSTADGGGKALTIWYIDAAENKQNIISACSAAGFDIQSSA